MQPIGPVVGEPCSPTFYRAALERLMADRRYQRNILWGEPRSGHPEGPIAAHIADLEGNAANLQTLLSEANCWRLRLLIHAHDTFKPEAAEGAGITDPCSHASLARAFLAGFCDDPELLTIVQFHDEPYALWRQEQHHRLNAARLERLFATVKDWDLFLAFLIVDGCTVGKSREPLHWFFAQATERGVKSRVGAGDVLNGMRSEGG